MNRIDPRAVQARRTEGWISSLTGAAVVAALGWLTVRYGWPVWIAGLAFAIAVVNAVLELAVLPGALYRSWRYAVTEKEIDLHHGYWVRKRTLIPMSRIQHVNSKQGPIQKGYGLATVTLATAAGSHHIPALSEAEAERVRRLISDWAGCADGEI
ncbi:PH domain-containing protein [Paenibacillus thailandensis]|uniref:PH domain-containing protein n=1 Tax=Paenibacillus thailandensis TaxID=393250 RepID=A0ABW5R0B5_9BACL